MVLCICLGMYDSTSICAAAVSSQTSVFLWDCRTRNILVALWLRGDVYEPDVVTAVV